MQPASDRPERSDTLRRYGPVAIIAVLVLVVGAVVLIGGGGGDDGDDEAEGSGAGALEWASTDGTEPGRAFDLDQLTIASKDRAAIPAAVYDKIGSRGRTGLQRVQG